MRYFWRDRPDEVPAHPVREKELLRLDGMTSPYPPSPRAMSVLDSAALERLGRYADPHCAALTLAIAAQHDVLPEQVLCAHGADELISLCVYLWGKRGVACADITYPHFSSAAAALGADVRTIPLREDYSLDDRDWQGHNRLMLIANPNTPTGLALLPRQVAHIAQGNPGGVVVVDEALMGYGAQTCIPLLGTYQNLLVIRTFSKAYALAGAKLGYALGHGELIEALRRAKQSILPGGPDALSQTLGVAVLADSAHVDRSCMAVQTMREDTTKSLREMGFEVLPSRASFLYCRHPRSSGEMLHMALLRRGIHIGYDRTPKSAEYVRISMGTREQMDALLSALRGMVAAAK